jgi:polysaccharide biosynthesis/export protein
MKRRFLQTCMLGFLLAAGASVAVSQEKSDSTDHSTNPPERSGAEQDQSVSRPVPGERNPRYLLRPSDVLQITFPFSPEFDQTVTVQPDGYISLRGVGDLHIAGQTVPELTKALHKAYGQFLHEPIINVELREFEKPYFIAGGEFGHPGKYELRGDTTVTEAVAIAGGFTERSKHSEVVLYRRGPLGWTAGERLNVKEMLNSKNLNEDPHLLPGDMIYVPKNALSKIKAFIPSTGLGLTVPF